MFMVCDSISSSNSSIGLLVVLLSFLIPVWSRLSDCVVWLIFMCTCELVVVLFTFMSVGE